MEVIWYCFLIQREFRVLRLNPRVESLGKVWMYGQAFLAVKGLSFALWGSETPVFEILLF